MIELPWPSRALHPNARVHWGTKMRATKKARADATIATLTAGIRKIDAQALHVTVHYFPPNRRAHDEDGVLASLKSALDGIADVVGVDDGKWSISMRRGEVRKHGAVLVEIEVAT